MTQILMIITFTLAIYGVTLFGLNWITNGRVGFGHEKVAPAAQAFMVFSAMNLLFSVSFATLVFLLGNAITGKGMPSAGESNIIGILSTFMGGTASLALSRKLYPETVHIPNTKSLLFVVALLTFLVTVF